MWAISGTLPAAENVKPPYFTRADVRVTKPCVKNKANGGEDFNADGKGLDNDGDLAYDGNDSDCAALPLPTRAWSVLKGAYGG